ncbi:hypothetical protein BKI52_00845 [marine bacterium AO1-C]|nr:hypothetical protein BKI52_00845 [marine bacterium AO1-C]
MEQVFRNDYLKIEVDQQSSIFYWEWSKETYRMSEEDFLSYSNKILGFVLQYSCKYGVENAIDFRFIISPDIQKMIAQQVIEKGRGRFKRLAHVVSSDFVSKLSVEQLWKEYERYNFQEKYFSDVEEAMTWVLEEQ